MKLTFKASAGMKAYNGRGLYGVADGQSVEVDDKVGAGLLEDFPLNWTTGNAYMTARIKQDEDVTVDYVPPKGFLDPAMPSPDVVEDKRPVEIRRKARGKGKA